MVVEFVDVWLSVISFFKLLLVWIDCLIFENWMSWLVNLVVFRGFRGFWYWSCVVKSVKKVLRLFVRLVVVFWDVVGEVFVWVIFMIVFVS